MSGRLLKKYPPYEGEDPYIYYCFSPSDTEKAEELLKRLWQRGCRIWYCIGETSDLKLAAYRHERMTGAGLAVVYVSSGLQRDSSKRNVMFLQSGGTPVIAVDGEAVTNLSLGLREQTPHIDATGGIDYGVESELISSELFSRKYIGVPPEKRLSGGIKAILAGSCTLAAAACAFFILSYLGLTGAPEVTEDSSAVTVITMNEFPEELSDLQQYACLEKIIVPQSLAATADEKDEELLRELAGKYTVVIDRES